MKTKFVLSVIGLGLAALGAGAAPAEECRGLWVDAFGPGFLNASQVKQLVSDCRRYNFNTVFVQMRRRGDAFYVPQPPNPDPRTTALATNYDALAEILKQCHEGKPRIDVHCWLTSHLVWSDNKKPPSQPKHVYNLHRDWLTRDATGQTFIGKGYYLDPGHPEVGQWLHDVAVDVVRRYDVDGLHWDYCRYPGGNAGYNRTALGRYRQEFPGEGNPAEDDAQFTEWRQRQVTDFLRWTTADLLQIKPRLVVSASVFANYSDSTWYRFADWVDWCKQGVVDVVIPMAFTPDTGNVFNQRAGFARDKQGVRAIYMGQGAFMNTPQNTVGQLRRSREMGFPGTVMFSYYSLVGGQEDLAAKRGETGKGDVVVDDAEGQVCGNWGQGRFGQYHGSGYAVSQSGAGTNSIWYQPQLPATGRYDVFEWHVAGGNRATDVPYEVCHRGGTNVVKVNQRGRGARWNFIGRYEFATNSACGVRISNAVSGTKRVVVADAIRFAPATQDALPDGKTPEERAREGLLAKVRKEFQPEWSDAPRLPWKARPARGIVKGRVVSATGQPVYNALVALGERAERTQKSEAHGGYAFFELDPGRYSVVAQAGDGTVSTNRVEVAAGSVVEVNLELNK